MEARLAMFKGEVGKLPGKREKRMERKKSVEGTENGIGVYRGRAWTEQENRMKT